MRSLLFPFCAFAALPVAVLSPLPAAAVEITPAVLQAPAWRVVGGTPAAGTSGWLVPTGTQVIRHFEPAEIAAGVAVRIRLQPTFSAVAKECSTVELGGVALVFQRVEQAAQVLVTKGGKVLAAWPVADIDDVGQLTRPITVQLRYCPLPEAVLVETAGAPVSVPLTADDGPLREFVLSTGAPGGLAVAELCIETDTAATVAAASTPTRAGADAASPTANDRAAGGAAPSVGPKGEGRPAPTAPEPSVAGTPAPVDASAWVPEEAATEQRLIRAATQQAAAGEFAEAWKTISETTAQAPSAARIGFRARSVAGFLRNMGRLAEAECFARLALGSPRLAPRQAKAGVERGETRYWRAALAADILHDPEEALRLSQADAGEPDDPRTAPLRARLQRRAETEQGQ